MSKKIPTLTVRTLDCSSYTIQQFQRWFQCDKRHPVEAFQRFCRLNKKAFDFLGITTQVSPMGDELQLFATQYVGSIPIRSPKTGNVVTTLLVTGRFNEDISELLSIVEETLLPEFTDDLPLLLDETVRPPIYFECSNYIDLYLKAKKTNWNKFETKVQQQSYPTSGTNWAAYALQSINPERALSYPNKRNVLSRQHPEWLQLTHVLDISIKTILAPTTPMRAQVSYMAKIKELVNTYDENNLPEVKRFHVKASDPQVIKELKELANVILDETSQERRAWRLNFSVFFERFVQCIFKQVARLKGAVLFRNPKYSIIGDRPTWVLRYLEPDLVIQHENGQCVLDAKYKSHLFNLNSSNVEELKETFRTDLHQLLAYCSFNTMTTKYGCLVYPAPGLIFKHLKLKSSLNGICNNVTLIGIPMVHKEFLNTIKVLSEALSFS